MSAFAIFSPEAARPLPAKSSGERRSRSGSVGLAQRYHRRRSAGNCVHRSVASHIRPSRWKSDEPLSSFGFALDDASPPDPPGPASSPLQKKDEGRDQSNQHTVSFAVP